MRATEVSSQELSIANIKATLEGVKGLFLQKCPYFNRFAFNSFGKSRRRPPPCPLGPAPSGRPLIGACAAPSSARLGPWDGDGNRFGFGMGTMGYGAPSPIRVFDFDAGQSGGGGRYFGGLEIRAIGGPGSVGEGVGYPGPRSSCFAEMAAPGSGRRHPSPQPTGNRHRGFEHHRSIGKRPSHCNQLGCLLVRPATVIRGR